LKMSGRAGMNWTIASGGGSKSDSTEIVIILWHRILGLAIQIDSQGHMGTCEGFKTWRTWRITKDKTRWYEKISIVTIPLLLITFGWYFTWQNAATTS
jgi:hypothetical protein